MPLGLHRRIWVGVLLWFATNGFALFALGGENLLTAEEVARFKFTLLSQKAINGRQAYEIAFEPKRPGSPVRHIIDRLLSRISGSLWIDAEEFEIARAQISLSSEVDFLGGVVGSL